jgi:hypothetical protein
MKRINILYKLVASFTVLLMGCSEDFFVTPPLAADTEASFYNSIDNLESATVACYSMLNAQGFVDHGHIMITGSIAADDMEGGGKGPNDTPSIQEIDRLLHTSQNAYFPAIWGYGYKGVYFCNQFLKYMPELNDGSLTDDEVATLNIRTGEIKFLRALYYFLLTQTFGGIVRLEHPVLLSELKSLKRATVKEMYELIEKDLSEAIDMLPTKANIDEVGRANKEAAQALMAKMLLYESSYAKYKAGDERFGDVQIRWAEALSFAQEVIASPNLSLPGLNGETYNTFWSPTTDAYRFIFSVDGDNNSGSIFETQDVCLLGGNGWIRERGNSLTKWTSFRQYPDENGETQNWGWGWMAPAQKLHDIYEDGDPRIKTVFGGEGDSALVTSGNWRPLDVSWSPTGYNLRKYEASPAQYWDISEGEWNRGPVNERIIRLADVYLWAAEAAFENNQTDLALEYLNTVRKRADMCDGTEDGVPSQLTSITIDDIRNERRRELAGEGDRYYDIVRWNTADEELSGLPILGGELKLDFVAKKHDFFPIPQAEIDVLNGVIKQYEGW